MVKKECFAKIEVFLRKFLRKIDVFVTFFRNFSERNVFYPSQWKSCRKFWQFFYKAPIILKKTAKFSIWGGGFGPKIGQKCSNLKRFCQRKWQDLAKFSIWGGIWSKNWQKCSNFKRFSQTEWPKPAKFSNWGGDLFQKLAKIFEF